MEKVLKQFDIIGKIISYEIYGEGHINDTYLVFVENNSKVIIAKGRLNTCLFPYGIVFLMERPLTSSGSRAFLRP